MSRFGLSAMLVGQGAWAASQLALLLLLTSYGYTAALGRYGVLLSVYAPCALLGSLNLRVSIAVDEARLIGPLPAIAARSAAALFGLLAIGATVTLIFGDEEQALSVFTLASIKVTEQFSDLASGFYQREGQIHRIGCSMIFRSLALLVPLGIGLSAGFTLLAASLAALIASLLITWLYDLRFLISLDSTAEDALSVRQLIRNQKAFAVYPLADSLHVAFLRYSVAYFCGYEVVGALMTFQGAFMPLQLLMSSLGVVYLARMRIYAAEFRAEAFRCLMLRAQMISLSLMVSVFAVALLAVELVFEVMPSFSLYRHASVLLAAVLAMQFIPSVGFSSLSVAVLNSPRFYSSLPVAGVASFSVGILVVSQCTQGALCAFSIAVAFAMSGALRTSLAVCFCLSRSKAW